MKRQLSMGAISIYGVLGATVDATLDLVRGGALENIEIFAGDSVTWRNDIDSPAHLEGYGKTWKSPIFHNFEEFSHTFTVPGRYIYAIVTYTGNPPVSLGTNIASVLVRPLEGDRPVVSIISPPDNSFVTYPPYPEAVVSRVESVVAVNFFRDGEFVAAATNAPYRVLVLATPGTHQIWAETVDAAGRTNKSRAITVTYTGGQNRTFNPAYIPNVGFVLNYATSNGTKARVFSSTDLETWSADYNVIAGQALVLVPRMNLPHAFFYVRGGTH